MLNISEELQQNIEDIVAQVRDEEDDPLANIIPAETGDPAELTEARMMARQVRELLPALTPQERQVLDLRYGLRDGRPRSLESVGKEFRLTR